MLPNHTAKNIQHRLQQVSPTDVAPKILVLFGSLRPNSHTRKLADEVMEMLEQFGAEARLFDPRDLPIFDGESTDHPKVQQLREWSEWCDGQVWISPEMHGNMSAVFKNQIDWLPLDQSAVRATQGKTLAVMQITGGSQSFNAVNNMRILGRWMRMFTIPNQSSIAKAWQEFDEDGKFKDSAFRDRVIDVLEELVKTTILIRGQSDYLTERFSEAKAALSKQAAEALKNQVEAAGAMDVKRSACCAPKTAPAPVAPQAAQKSACCAPKAQSCC
ncbi:arsenical resistance protein ArsH [Microbulbifer agarilyticus]|uniref:arsenical resistance protein ArsH n=1 Tax=Microbulbifer agarilyticus TaxID=260552 RepID=UPI001C967068|nr:arsenical resistance protein ArsH [Microbulbifer agarilyticus]